TRSTRDWSSDVCSSDLADRLDLDERHPGPHVGLRHVAKGQHLGTAGLCEDDRFHPGLLRRQARQYTGGGMRLQGRIAAITGGALGIGRATARLFAAEGATVALGGGFFCCQAAARQMVRQGGGRIIATASINGFRGVENLVGYNVAKAGVIELTKTLAVELAKHHIAVNAIAPAQIDTRLTRSLPEEARRRRVDRIPMGRFGDVDEVARAALFLASDDASYVTGHTLAVDGGYLAGGLWSR